MLVKSKLRERRNMTKIYCLEKKLNRKVGKKNPREARTKRKGKERLGAGKGRRAEGITTLFKVSL